MGDRFVSESQVQAMIAEAVNKAYLDICRAPRPFKIFGLDGSKGYAESVATELGIKVTPHDEKTFEDGEPYAKSVDGDVGNVRGHNVFVIQSLYSDKDESVSDKFMKLCIMCGSLNDASAHEVTAVIPHLAFARQDRKTQSREPITTKYIARMLEACGIARALFVDVHNLAAEQNAFTVPIDILEAKNLHAAWCAQKLIEEGRTKKIKVLTPDSGGLSRCERFRKSLLKGLINLGVKLDDIEIVIFDKLRVEGHVRGGRIVGDVEDADVIAYDDMISTGGTMRKACSAVLKRRGRIFAICATHGLFCGEANNVFDGLDAHLVVADTVQPFRLNDGNRKKVHLVETTKMVADAIRRIHSGSGSISELLR
jgi:ribose-phosphate pyrophosphokinase